MQYSDRRVKVESAVIHPYFGEPTSLFMDAVIDANPGYGCSIFSDHFI